MSLLWAKILRKNVLKHIDRCQEAPLSSFDFREGIANISPSPSCADTEQLHWYGNGMQRDRQGRKAVEPLETN